MDERIVTEAEHTPKVLLLRTSRVLVVLVYAFMVAVVVLLVIAFFLALFGANPEAGFSEWIYRATRRVMEPFRGLFSPVDLSEGSVLDLSLLFAILIYGLVALGMNALIVWLTHSVHHAERRAQLRLAADERAAQRPPAYDPRTPYGADQARPPGPGDQPPAGLPPDRGPA